jgi:alpha-beta hydrolase superfamily lysophospholipase
MDTWIAAEDGARLFVRQWLPDSEPEAAIQIVHGMGEHSLRYDRFARFLCDAGYVVRVMDVRGHGRTADPRENSSALGGKLGHCADKNAPGRLVGDIRLLNEGLRHDYPAVPLFLMGHSWGSLLVQAYIEDLSGPPLCGCILSGTRGPDARRTVFLGWLLFSFMLLFRRPQSVSRFAAMLVSRMYRRKGAPSFTKQDWLSTSFEEVEAFVHDPLCGKMPTLGFYRDLAFLLHSIHKKENMARVPLNMPMYVFSGALDTAGNKGESPKALVKEYIALGMEDIGFVLYPGARHEMLHEENYMEVQLNLLSWLNKYKKKRSTPCATGTRGKATDR